MIVCLKGSRRKLWPTSKVLSWHENGGSEEIHEKPQNSLRLCQDSNRAEQKNKSEKLPRELTCFGSFSAPSSADTLLFISK